MSDRIMNVTAAAAWLFAFCVMAFAIIFVMISKVSAEVYGNCPDVFTTQDVCYIPGADKDDLTKPSEREINTSVYTVTGTFTLLGEPTEMSVSALAIFPIDGCSSFVGGLSGPTIGGDPKKCFAPLRFTVGDNSYCIQDNTAKGWQLCSTDDTMTMPAPMPQEVNDPPANQATTVTTADYQSNCGHRSPGVYGTDDNPLLCWADQVGGNLGGDDDPWNKVAWTTFTDCTPEGCRTYGN